MQGGPVAHGDYGEPGGFEMSGRGRAAVVESPGVMRLREFPLPEIGEDDGLLKVEMCGVCGSDAKYFYGKIKHRAVNEGMLTLRKHGIRKVLDGVTTIDEVKAATLADHT